MHQTIGLMAIMALTGYWTIRLTDELTVHTLLTVTLHITAQ